jgi:hypothetical protein
MSINHIVERLREIEWPLTQEAAAEIERLQAENDRLWIALKEARGQ